MTQSCSKKQIQKQEFCQILKEIYSLSLVYANPKEMRITHVK